MLTSITIKNYALIEKLAINFSDKFTVITGETGAGKSILLGALGLVLGKRADLTSLKNKDEKCVVEAHFEISRYNLNQFFELNDLDFQEQTIIRREILPNGKSRAFVNDSPVNLQLLQDLSTYLIDIHSQHQTSELSDENYQFLILDAIAENHEDINAYGLVLAEYKRNTIFLTALLEQKNSLSKEQSYNSFLLEELLASKLVLGQQEEFEALFETLNNVELIKEQLDKTFAIANDDQIGVQQNLKEIKSLLQKTVVFSPKYNQFHERISSILIDFNDVIDEVREETEILIGDPEKLELITNKLQVIYSLQKKHQVSSVDELLLIQGDLENKVIKVDEIEFDILKHKSLINKNQEKLNDLAQQISKKRRTAIPVLIDRLTTVIKQLGMPDAQFQIEIEQSEHFYSNGKDTISFLFSGNKGSNFGILKKVASGGELSRIMLAVKATLAHYSKLPTILFDEIDTGVSGDIANKMAEIMKGMSVSMQVFAITHLPQIAAKGNQHYKVYKINQGEKTISEIKLLNDDERILEIAEILSGKNSSDSALNLAKSLLN